MIAIAFFDNLPRMFYLIRNFFNLYQVLELYNILFLNGE